MIGKVGFDSLLRTAVDHIHLLLIVLAGAGPLAAIEDHASLPDFSAEDRVYWAFQPIRRPEPLRVWNSAGVTTPVDGFIVTRLEQSGLPTAQKADRLTLLRRVKFDLHGLLPTLLEQERFLAEKSPAACEHLVDRLLARSIMLSICVWRSSLSVRGIQQEQGPCRTGLPGARHTT